MNLNCQTCGRTVSMPFITDPTVLAETGFSSGWVISPTSTWCPACATALLALQSDDNEAVA